MNTFKRLSFPNVFTEAGMKKSFPFQGSLLRIPEIPRTAFILGAFFLLTTGFWFYLLQILHPPCCDARFYLELGSKLQSEGADTFKQQLRTFGYP